MKLVTQTPKKALKAFLKQKPLRSEIDVFKTNLIALLDKISVIDKRPKDESEEHLKNDLRDFLRDTYYRDTKAINTKDKKDLVIHLNKTTNSEVGVIIEAKRPTNIGEMVTADNPNKKALHELILYYLDERNQAGNNQLKQLVMTNVHEWFIVDANYFDKHIYRNTQIKKLYETKLNDKKDNPFFYEEIAKIVSKIDVEIPCVYFDIREYDTILRNNNKEDDRELIALFKILSPQHLLKIVTPNDSNSLNEKFYKELLHIIGLEEAKENGKNIIRRKKENRNAASLIESAIEALHTEDVLHRLPDQSIYGDNKEERIFNISLELCITWINRILFLKLLEGQLITYHAPTPSGRAGGGADYRFLNTETIHDFDELFKLFHKVLAVNIGERSEAIKTKYSRVPYLNSSLFEISELEDQTIKINSLDNSGQLELIGTTILKNIKKKAVSLPTLDYLFQFLDAYDFASEGAEDVQEDNKTIINASVLGKVFEKINGYKDGSIFTPAFITMYMCKQSIRLAVVEKFNDAKKWDIKQFDELYNKIDDKKEANEIINSLRICDPAVGSGHFLVSALNEIIAVKSELGILIDEKGKTLRDYEIEIVNDELIITDENGNIIAYNPKNIESNRVQKTLFQEKQTIIENCLFGVDINPNSVKICRLRLWIELLKNAYYKEETKFTELETLPNIDINIKCGNSLLSRFPLDADLSKALKSIKYDIKAYRGFVNDYKNEKSRDVKRGLQKIIDTIKTDFRTEIGNNDPKQIKLSKLSGDLYNLLNQGKLFELDSKQKKKQKENQAKLEADITKLAKEIEEIKSNAIYKNAFEWRFEFPEVLSNNGEFEGFDVVIGNPPYFSLSKIKEQGNYFESAGYKTYSKGADIYCLFYERGNQILKDKGILTYITSNSWLRTQYGKSLRRYFVNHTNPLFLLNIEDKQLFQEATVESNIFAFEKALWNKKLQATSLKEDFNISNSLYDYFSSHSFIIKELPESGWTIGNENEGNLKLKIETGSKLFINFDCQINYGVKTGYNEAFVIDKKIKDGLLKLDPNCSHLLKPILRGRDIQKWIFNFKELWIIYIPKGYTIKNKFAEDGTNTIVNEPIPRYGYVEIDAAWEWFSKKHPSLAVHLLPFRNKAKNRLDQGDYWWEQRACAYLNDFEKEKIIWGELSDIQKFAYDESGLYANNTIFFITGKNLKYLLAVLNSKVAKWYFNEISTSSGMGTSRWLKYKIEQLPIKNISEKDQKPFISLVDKILEAKQQGKDSIGLEKKIDEMVYELYNITEEEQKIIEG